MHNPDALTRWRFLLITRQQTSVGRVDKSILDYVIVSEELCNQLEEMIIHDEVFNNHGG